MGNLDADLAAHLLQLRAAHGERTAVFIVSDHGIHYGKYYDRAQAGPREHALPLAYALLPRSTLARWPKMAAALEANEQRLVSPFDLHGMRDARMRACVHPCLRSHRRASAAATLLHVLSYPEEADGGPWGRSILSTIPRGRSCDDAGIPPGTLE
jgi:hypothetical protein